METNKTIKGPEIEFSGFRQFVGIWLLIAANPGTKRVEYFSENPIDIFGGCSIRVNQFMSGNRFESV